MQSFQRGVGQRRSGKPGRVQGGADVRREPRGPVLESRGRRGEARAECIHHRRGVVEYAAAVRHRKGFVRRHSERAVRRDDAGDELARAARPSLIREKRFMPSRAIQ